jgi:hypothetical protein
MKSKMYLDLLVLALLVPVPVPVLAPALPLCRRLGSRPVPATATVIFPFKQQSRESQLLHP